MMRRPSSIWRRIAARSPDITLAIAIAATLGTGVWLVWRLGWL